MTVSASTVAVPVLAAVAIGCLGGVVVVQDGHSASRPHAVAPAKPTAPATTSGDEVARLQQHLRQVPRDWQAWGSLGFDYVQRAKATVDPTYYPKAEQALARSLALQPTDNVVALAGEASLAAARHDFRRALAWAQRGLRVDPQSGVLYGALDDALTQLGRYREASTAATRMEEVEPGTGAEARLSYAAELRGDLRTATGYMRLALDDAAAPDDVAFTRYYLGDLALNRADARAALADYDAGLAVDPTYVALREGRARAEAALGDVRAALADYARVVQEVPQPGWLVEYGELLQAQGRADEAAQQFAVVRVEERLFTANGVTLDSDATLFEADHGDGRAAVALGAAAVRTRPFLDSYDAYAWALHRAGHNHAALAMADRALATGMRNPLFRYHRGVIELALGMHRAGRADLAAALRINPAFNPLAAPMARHLLGVES